MKKEYIEPSVKAIAVKPAQIICSSEEKLTDPQNPSGALSLDLDFEEEEE